MIRDFLIQGAVGGAVLSLVAFLLSRFTREIAGRVLLAAVLLVAAGNYIWFAASDGAGTGWVVTEVIGVTLFGGFALRGLRSPIWLALGWALHPIWDLGLHSFGPGHFAPEAYPISCLSYDLVVAVAIVVSHRWGLVARRHDKPVASTT